MHSKKLVSHLPEADFFVFKAIIPRRFEVDFVPFGGEQFGDDSVHVSVFCDLSQSTAYQIIGHHVVRNVRQIDQHPRSWIKNFAEDNGVDLLLTQHFVSDVASDFTRICHTDLS